MFYEFIGGTPGNADFDSACLMRNIAQKIISE